MRNASGLPHLPQLDGVRAVAVLLVFVAHCGWANVIPGGFGVTLFFFLSGYLITSLLRTELAHTGQIDLPAFYLRRTARIWPPLYLTMIIAGAATVIWLPESHIDVGGVVAQALFVSNYAPELGVGQGIPSPPLWSLAVEEHFYIVFPPLFALWLRHKPSARAAVWCSAACVVVLVIRIGSASVVTDLSSLYYWSHTRVDSILFGCCLALWQNPVLDEHPWSPGPGAIATAVLLLIACLKIRNEVFRNTLRYTLQGIAMFIAFSGLLQTKGPIYQILASRPLRVIGIYWYSMYLVHRLFIDLTIKYWPGLSVIGLIVVAGSASMLYAAAMYRIVERPMAAFRRSLHKSDRNAALAPIR